MEVTAYNPQKGRVETLNVHFTEDTTTWFESTGNPESVSMITDLDGNLLISLDGRNYPVIIYDISRVEIRYSRKKAGTLYKEAV